MTEDYFLISAAHVVVTSHFGVVAWLRSLSCSMLSLVRHWMGDCL